MPREFLARIRGTTEGVVFLVGIFLALALTVEWVFIWLADPHVGGAIAAQVAGELVSGREVGVPVGLSLGAPAPLVVQYSTLQDVASVALTYPIFLHLLHKYHDRNTWLMRRIRTLESAGEHHEKFVRRWGPLGIYLFMLVPFIFNGPLVGAMAGRIAGIHTRNLVVPVVCATLTVAILWTLAFEEIFLWAQRFGITEDTPKILFALPTLIIVILLAGIPAMLDYLKHRREMAQEAMK